MWHLDVLNSGGSTVHGGWFLNNKKGKTTRREMCTDVYALHVHV